MEKRYHIYCRRPNDPNILGRLSYQPKNGYDYEYEAELAIKGMIEAGSYPEILNFAVIKLYSEKN